jgi:predicted amidohydrolase YtcJ
LILKLGAKNEVLVLKGNSTKLEDLEGKAMLRGFIDEHAHFANFEG